MRRCLLIAISVPFSVERWVPSCDTPTADGEMGTGVARVVVRSANASGSPALPCLALVSRMVGERLLRRRLAAWT